MQKERLAGETFHLVGFCHQKSTDPKNKVEITIYRQESTHFYVVCQTEISKSNQRDRVRFLKSNMGLTFQGDTFSEHARNIYQHKSYISFKLEFSKKCQGQIEWAKE